MASEISRGADTGSQTSYDSDGSGSDYDLRWQGPASTWRAHNAEELSTATALEATRDRDLSLHLYNAFALKHRRKAANVMRIAPEARSDQDIDAETGHRILAGTWVPPRSWATWPLGTSRVPPCDFLRPSSEQEPPGRLTMHVPHAANVHAALQDAIAADILGAAKDRFLSRRFNADPGDGNGAGDSQDTPSESELDHNKLHGGGSGRASRKTREHIKPEHHAKELIPVVSADDDSSREVLESSIQHIISKIDATLATLHNAQEAATAYVSEGSDSDSGYSARSRQKSASRELTVAGKHGITLRPEFVREFVAQWDPDAPLPEGTAQDTSKRGRPRKKYARLEAESDTEYVQRVSRMRKMRVSARMDGRTSQFDENGSARSLINSNGGDIASGAQRTRAQLLSDRRRSQLRPRDWTDVLSAASMSGFSPRVLDRAARRCADIFEQQVRVHSLEEVRHDQDTWFSTQSFVAGMLIPSMETGQSPDGHTKSEERAQQGLERLGSASFDSEVERTAPRGRATSRGRSLSTTSRSASANASGAFPCKVVECPRSSDPFPRRANMVRHMKQVHNLKVDVDVDSEDEMHGAVHVDGYLKPVRVRPGWRRHTLATSTGDPALQRKRKRGRRVRPGDDASS